MKRFDFAFDRSLGWTESYNFGSEAAVAPRWRAAIAADVEFIATDQYEELTDALRATDSASRAR